MPIYEYSCQDCGERFEEIMSSSATTCPPCPQCASARTEKLMSACRVRTGGGSQAGGATARAASSSGGGCSGCAGGNCATCH